MHCTRTESAAYLLYYARNSDFGTTQAMIAAGFSTMETVVSAYRKRVLRLKDKMVKQVHRPPPPSSIELQKTSLMSQLTTSPALARTRAAILGDQTAEAPSPPASTLELATSPPRPRPRRTQIQVHRDAEYEIGKKKKQERAYLAAARMYKYQATLPLECRRSAREIVAEVNKFYGSCVSHKTVLRRVKLGLSTVVPRPGGGRIPGLNKQTEEALVKAISAFISLRNAQMRKKPDRKDILQGLEECLIKGPTDQTDYVSLYRRLYPKYSKEINVSVGKTKIEERRAVWTTYNNINTWFDTVKKIL